MQVKDIMIRKVICASPEMKITEIAKLLFGSHYHGLPVVEKGKIVGLVTKSDFFAKNSSGFFLPAYVDFLKDAKTAGSLSVDKKEKIKDILNLKAKDIMTNEVLTVFPEAEVSDLLATIRKTGFNTIPVVDRQKNIAGIVTLADIIGMVKQQNFGETDDLPAREADKLVKNVNSWWRKSAVFVSRTQIRSWKAILIIVFIAGALAALIWTMSISIEMQ